MAEKTTNQSKPRVLVADDEQVIANTLAIILNQAGFEARAVYSGEKALDALDTFHPDMLISDVIMTGMTGIEAAIQTRAKLPNCKILLFSGQAATADLLERARTQGHEFDPGQARASDRPSGEASRLRRPSPIRSQIGFPSRWRSSSRHFTSIRYS
jgi:CheY-like chemotaxis protein